MSSFEEDMQYIEKGSLQRVYLLYGGEQYLEEQAIQNLFTSFKKSCSSGVDRKIYYGDDGTDALFIQSLTGIGMFCSYQFVVFKNIQKLNPSHRKILLRYIENPDTNTLLVMTADRETKSSLVDNMKKSRSIKTIYTITPESEKFPAIILSELSRRGYQISEDALELLVSCTDDSLAHTFSELEKIFLASGDSKKITVEIVSSIVGADKTYQVDDLVMAVGKRNIQDAVKISLALINAGETMPFIVVKLFHYFQNVWVYPYLYQNSNEKNPYKQKQVLRFKIGYENYRDSDFGSIFQYLTDVDLKSKSVNLSAEELIVPLLCEIINI